MGMTTEQAVERYVAEILRIVGQRAGLEVEVTQAAREAMRRNHADEDVVALAGEIAGTVFRRRMWRD